METMRASGIQSGGPSALSPRDRQQFANELDKWIINEPALPQVDDNLDTFNGNDSNNAFLNDNSGWA
jgi:hypothetical protein